MKKGVMFSFIMVFITITVISLIAIQRSLVSHRREQMHVETRINSMNNMHESIVRDIKKTTEIIGRRAISISINHVVENGEGLPDGQAIDTLEDLIFNITPSGWDDDELFLMENATLPYWMDRIEEVSVLRGFEVNITIKDFEIKPYDSWHLLSNVNVSVNITDKQGVASIRRNITVNELISIVGLEDPLYPLNTYGRVTNFVFKSPYENYTEFLVKGDGSNKGWEVGTSFLIWSADEGIAESVPNPEEKILVTDNVSKFNSGDVNDFKGLVTESDISPGITLSVYVVNATNAMNSVPNNTIILVDSDIGNVTNIENLRQHLSGGPNENSYYSSSSNGPSFLDRLEGKLTCDYCSQVEGIGLESFINKTYFLSRYVDVVTGDTNVDYPYFSGTSGDCVKGLDSTFRIDDGHKDTYNVTNLWYSCS